MSPLPRRLTDLLDAYQRAAKDREKSKEWTAGLALLEARIAVEDELSRMQAVIDAAREYKKVAVHTCGKLYGASCSTCDVADRVRNALAALDTVTP